jgi:hypothetical protein
MEKAFAAMSWGSPIGNIKGPRGISGVITDQGSEPLVVGQAFVDVVFNTIQENPDWIFVECTIFNLVDASPLNVHAGILTGKTTTGFRLQLSGLPDTANYYLRWSVNGEPIPPTNASRYLLTGPTAGLSGTASAPFTVKLPPSTIVPAPITITPRDGGAGGTFAPTSVTLPADAVAAAATFTYTPAAVAGTKTVGVTNDSGLSDPAGIGYDVTVPFSPASVAGLKLWLRADSILFGDNTPLTHWNDSSANAYNLTSGAATLKANIVNGKPVVRFNGTSDKLFSTTEINIPNGDQYTLYIVMKAAAGAQRVMANDHSTALSVIIATDGAGHFIFNAGGSAIGTIPIAGGFHVNTVYQFNGAVYSFVDGAADIVGANAGSAQFGAVYLGAERTNINFTACDIAELLVYDPQPAGPDDNANITQYLGDKYGIAVSSLRENVLERIMERRQQ